MEKLEAFKASLKGMGCHFTNQPTLHGTTITIYSGEKKILFEFNLEGKFIKTKIE